MAFVIGIDASRNRSGGAIAHLIGILTECNVKEHDIKEIHIWSHRSLLDKLPNVVWLIKHNPISLEMSLLHQLIWQAFSFSKELKLAGCDILFSTSATSASRFKPMVSLSQDMLCYEPGIMQYFGVSRSRLRLITILFLQNFSFRRSNGVIFLTHYAGKMIQRSCGILNNVSYIPHGIDDKFKQSKIPAKWPKNEKEVIRFIYVSNTEIYKHQWVVVKALSLLRKKGHNLSLTLVGSSNEPARSMTLNAIRESNLNANFVEQLEFLPHNKLPDLLLKSNIFIFASSCENMPITLLEAMATGLPIASSNRGPMPEILQDGGVYFDPEDEVSIANAGEALITSKNLRLISAEKARTLSLQYSWQRCSYETFSYISKIYHGTTKARK